MTVKRRIKVLTCTVDPRGIASFKSVPEGFTQTKSVLDRNIYIYVHMEYDWRIYEINMHNII